MDFQAYLQKFDDILNTPTPVAPYDDPAFFEYTKLNRARLNRWLKQGKVDENIYSVIKQISKPQSWISITEPWCGDAAHIVPIIDMLAKINPLITVDYELRDSPPFRIENYLTNGSKSIPILIVKDENGIDLFHWGPRPKAANNLYNDLKERGTDLEEIKIALQNWYNIDKGQSLQNELLLLLK